MSSACSRPIARRANNDKSFTKLYKYLQGNLTQDSFQQIVKLPMGISLENWLTVVVLEIFDNLGAIYCVMDAYCSPQTCAKSLNAFQICKQLWNNHKHIAPHFINLFIGTFQHRLHAQHKNKFTILDNSDRNEVANIIIDNNNAHFVSIVKNICTHLFRLFEHLYYCHLHQLIQLNIERQVNTCLKHLFCFVKEFNFIKNASGKNETFDNEWNALISYALQISDRKTTLDIAKNSDDSNKSWTPSPHPQPINNVYNANSDSESASESESKSNSISDCAVRRTKQRDTHSSSDASSSASVISALSAVKNTQSTTASVSVTALSTNSITEVNKCNAAIIPAASDTDQEKQEPAVTSAAAADVEEEEEYKNGTYSTAEVVRYYLSDSSSDGTQHGNRHAVHHTLLAPRNDQQNNNNNNNNTDNGGRNRNAKHECESKAYSIRSASNSCISISGCNSNSNSNPEPSRLCPRPRPTPSPDPDPNENANAKNHNTHSNNHDDNKTDDNLQQQSANTATPSTLSEKRVPSTTMYLSNDIAYLSLPSCKYCRFYATQLKKASNEMTILRNENDELRSKCNELEAANDTKNALLQSIVSEIQNG